ncbi:DPP IV N-terminal domain-containing protein [Sandaracinus amylolyticus]|uniref:DPP IV N-terminal domain-containing protein n=1 Tax=Sandaracinus amylolyticus TaxID=927083 RepID=UPI001F47277E|nr:DPP IV N-terminal domain-containing protein [Sandaracinus amylolyticus]
MFRRPWASAAVAAMVIGCGSNASEEETGADPTTAPPIEAAPTPPASIADPDFLEQYAVTYRFNHGHPGGFRLTPEGDALLFLRSGPRSFVNDLWTFDVAGGTERVLLTADQVLNGAEEELSAEERARRERMRMTSRGIAGFDLSPDARTLLVPLSGRLFLVDRAHAGEQGSVRELTSSAGFPVDARFSPDGSKIAVVREGDLYVIDVASGRERRITTRPNEHVEYGSAEFVAQEEMSRYEGYWWSPDSRSLLVQETDTSGVERMHILDPSHPEQSAHESPYPRPGMPNASVRLALVSANGGALRYVDWDRERYPYLATVRWAQNAPITILVQDRAQQEEALLAIDPSSLEQRTLLTERDDAWLNLDQDVPRFIANGAQFLWTSERSGEWRLEVRNTADGALIRELTPQELGYHGLVAVDEASGKIWLSASNEPSEMHVYRVSLDGTGEPEQMTSGRAMHEAVVARNGSAWVHTARTLEGPRTSTVKRADGAEAGVVRSYAEEAPFAPNVTIENVGARAWRAAIVRPRNFEEGRRYPVLVHVYAGPGVRYVSADRDRWMLNQWFADHGFIVVTFDGRGTPGRGREWERAIRGDFITVPLEDQVAALQAAGAAHPEMDLEHVGIYGWSFGGYFSAMAVLRRPDVFRAGIAGAPVSEWRDYDTHYTERYLGLPEAEGQQGAYAQSSVLTYAARSEGDQRPLLIVHGTADDNVYFSHAIKLSDAMFRAGRDHEFLPLAGLTHMVPEPLVTRRLQTRMIEFFRRNLVR